MYVERLIAPDVVNTMPEATLRAFADHGETAQTLGSDSSLAWRILVAAHNVGVNLDEITAELEREGVQSFCTSYDELLRCIDTKLAAISGRVDVSG
jgi:transaldolase